MDNDLGLEEAECPSHELWIGDRPFDDRQPVSRFQVVTPAGGEIVDDEDFVAAFEKAIGDVGADESGASSDQYVHDVLLTLCQGFGVFQQLFVPGITIVEFLLPKLE